MDALEEDFAELYKELGRRQGIDNPLMMVVFSRIFIEPEDIALDQLAMETGYSLASVSNAVKHLGMLTPIDRIKKPGSKKLYLKVEKDFMKLFLDTLVRKDQLVISLIKEKVPGMLKEHKPRAKSSRDRERIRILETYLEQVTKCGKIMQEMIRRFDEI